MVLADKSWLVPNGESMAGVLTSTSSCIFLSWLHPLEQIIPGWPPLKRGLLRKFNITLQSMSFYFGICSFGCLSFGKSTLYWPITVQHLTVIGQYNVKFPKLKHPNKHIPPKKIMDCNVLLKFIFGVAQANRLLTLGQCFFFMSDEPILKFSNSITYHCTIFLKIKGKFLENFNSVLDTHICNLWQSGILFPVGCNGMYKSSFLETD